MATSFGAYTGKVLKIDLTKKTSEEYPLYDKDRELFLGGKTLAARIIFDYIDKPIDPLGEDNILVITSGPLTGTGCPSSSRFNVSTISPLTNILTSSNCGGNFALNMKKAGYDALIITGKSEKFIYLDINDKTGITYNDAEPFRGMLTGEVQKAIGGRSGKLVIGPAGEHLVRYACAVSEDRAAGRGGIGAVMGSKNLKAIVCSGTKLQLQYNQDKLSELKKAWTKRLRSHPLTGEQLPKLGTAGLLSNMQQKSILGTKNFEAGRYDDYNKINGEAMAEDFLIKNKGCITCPIQCARVVNLNGKAVKGPEVEILGLMGSNILNNDLQKIIEWNYELDELGMDTISASSTIAFAMALNEKKMWDNDLEFGKIDNITDILHQIAHRSSEIGDLLANGSKFLSEKFGGEDFCNQVKGMELSAYEPRSAVGQGLGYAVSNRGGCHLNAGYSVVLEGLGMTINPYTTIGKAQLVTMFQSLMESVSSAGCCLFTTYAFFPYFLMNKPNMWLSRFVNWILPYLGIPLGIINKYPGLARINLTANLPHPKAIYYATGIKMTMGGLMKIGSRGYNLERLINTKLGITASDDKLPKHLTSVLQDPKNPKSKVPLEKLKKQFYRARGWTQGGLIKESTLRYYGINHLDKIFERELESDRKVKVIPPKPKKTTAEKKAVINKKQ